MAKFEVTVYNTQVRKMVEAGEHHFHCLLASNLEAALNTAD